VGGTHDLKTNTFDQEDDTLTFVKVTGTFEAWMSLDSGGVITITSSAVAGTYTGFSFSADDGTNSPVTSDTFSIVVNAVVPLAAFPGAEGFGTDTTHGRGGIVVEVTNLNESGAGSFRAALEMTVPRIVIFTVSGTIALEDRIILLAANSDVFVAGQTAPGDGICIKSDSGEELLSFSRKAATTPFHDGLFQHIRMRHSAQWRNDDTTNTVLADNFVAAMGTHDLVFDHCSFTWHGDEAFSLYGGIVNDFSGGIFNITISHCIIGEGAITSTEHNYGPLMSGMWRINQDQYNISIHHNLCIHSFIRNFKMDAGSGEDNRGHQFSNNIHYNCYGQNYSAFVNWNSGDSRMWIDVINDYYQVGPQDTSNTRPFRVGQSPAPKDVPPGGTVYQPSLYLVGSTWRNQDGTNSTNNNEADNFTESDVSPLGYIKSQYTPRLGWVERGTAQTTQPANPVTIQSAQAGYDSVVVGEDCGAKPHDSVDARLVGDPEDEGGYSMTNVGPPWGTGSYPTLSTAAFYAGDEAKPVGDTSGNGLPDYYQVDVLGKDIGDAYNPADTFTVGNDYSDIENWIISVTL
jgi:hypothetical protein